MQTLPPLSTWADVFKFLIGTFIGLIPWLISTYRNRKKSDIENAEAVARTELAQVNARSTEIRDYLAAGEGLGKLLSALVESGDTIHDLQGRIFALEQEKLGHDMLRLDLKKALALLAYKGYRFSEAEHPEVKVLVERLKELVP